MKDELNLMVLADILQLPIEWLLNDKILLKIKNGNGTIKHGKLGRQLLITFVYDFINEDVIKKSPCFVYTSGPYVGVPFFTISDYYFELPDDFNIDNIKYENDVMK